MDIEVKYNSASDEYGDDDTPKVDIQPYQDQAAEPLPKPLPESSRPRRDGPGGE